jgi:hypothetical protein
LELFKSETHIADREGAFLVFKLFSGRV